MTRSEAEALVAALVKLRGGATDALALEAQGAYPAWQAGKGYAAGDRVRHGGTLYNVLQGHTSQADWTPDAAVSLFSKVLIPDATAIPAWEQPDSTNPYAKGDKVTHSGKT